MGMALFKEWAVCLTVVLGFKFSSSHLRPQSAEIDIFPKGFYHRAEHIIYIHSGQKAVRPILCPCLAEPRVIVRPV